MANRAKAATPGRSKKQASIDELFPPEFTAATVDLPELLGIVEPLASELVAHNEYVSLHGYASLPAVETMLDSIWSHADDLRSWVEVHRFWLDRNPHTIQQGVFHAFEILAEASAWIDRTIPNDPNVEYDGPSFIKLSPGMEPFQFDATLLANVKFVAESVRAWLPPKTAGPVPLDKETAAVLRYLAANYPILCTYDDIGLGSSPNLARNTVSKCLDTLDSAGYTLRREGTRKGVNLTESGIEAAKLLPPAGR